MADCVCVPGCPFFNDRMAGMPALANQMKRKYCQGNFETCARFTVMKALGRERVPADMFPNQVERAAEILTAG